MNVQDLLSGKDERQVVTAASTDSVGAAAALLDQWRIGAVLVRDAEGRICGFISERDIVHGMAEYGRRVGDLAVEQLMTRTVVTCGLQTDVEEVMQLMTDNRTRYVQVVEADRLVGIVSIGDVVRSLEGAAELQIVTMTTYVMTT